MRAKQLRVILTFAATTDAMAMERYCQANGVPGRLIPVPSAISAGCGMCWSAPPEARDAVESAAEAAALRKEGIYELMI
ncbi:MAG: DUF3343 domain-containing protein [Oscillospiraceae bacterium]|nr:DUF3343 domain-containing protein [Oscillospiraceae bacterium]